MNKQTKQKLEDICKYITPNGEFHDTPYKCGFKGFCTDIFEYGGILYCGRTLKLERLKDYKFNGVNDRFGGIE